LNNSQPPPQKETMNTVKRCVLSLKNNLMIVPAGIPIGSFFAQKIMMGDINMVKANPAAKKLIKVRRLKKRKTLVQRNYITPKHIVQQEIQEDSFGQRRLNKLKRQQVFRLTIHNEDWRDFIHDNLIMPVFPDGNMFNRRLVFWCERDRLLMKLAFSEKFE
jgi:hypothetical protein